MVRVLFSSEDEFDGKQLIIRDSNELRHLKVVRVEPGEEVEVLDGKGVVYRGYFVGFKEGKFAEIRIVSHRIYSKVGRKFFLACSLISSNRFDEIIGKVAEFGCDVFIPMLCERTIVRDLKIGDFRDRWTRKAIQVCRQTGAPFFPEIMPVCSFEDVVGRIGLDMDYKFIPYLGQNLSSFWDSVVSIYRKQGQESVLIVIGPEGDFSSGEVEYAVSMGFVPVSLGKMILRVETAAGFCAGLLSQLKGYVIEEKE